MSGIILVAVVTAH